MHSPDYPHDETQRIQALLDTGLLDSQPEERFDRLTLLAKETLQVPTALISLLDTDRQWFKSRQGFNACETSRSISFCGHAILGSNIFEVEDALEDGRFLDNPLVVGSPHIRFYAGAPLTTSDGYRIGTLCIISDQPRKLNRRELGILRSLADCVEAEISHIDLLRQSQAVEMAQQLGDVISRAQSQFIQEDQKRKAFDYLLNDLLILTGSEYGFIGEILRKPDETPYLKTYAITNIAWDQETQAFYEAHAHQGLEFTKLNSLFGAAMLTGEPVISNSPDRDNRSSGLPKGHPELNAFLGVPVFHGDEMLAMFGLANRLGGYNEKLLTYLQPLIATVGQLVHAERLRKQKQETEAELARLSRVASETTNGVIITDTNGKVRWINEGFTRMTGYAIGELLDRKPGELLQGPQTDPNTVLTMTQALASHHGFEVEIVNYAKNSQPYWVRINCSPLLGTQGDLQGFMAIESDITQQKQSEKELLQFKSTLDQTLDCVFMFDANELRFFYANEGALRQVGYEKSELFTMHPYDIKPEITEENFRQKMAPLLSGETASITFDTLHQHKSGKLIPVEAFVQFVAPKNGNSPHFVAIVRDITERKRIEQALLEQARYTQTIIDNMVNGLITIDAQGVVQSFNLAAQQMFGYEAQEILGKNIKILMPAPHRDMHDTYLQNFKTIGEARVLGVSREIQGLRKDGHLFPIEIAVSKILHNGKNQYVGLVTDITERKQNEARMRYLATHDALTGLPNRTLFMDRLSHDIARAQRDKTLVGVLLLDLDNFKVVNDSFGHHQGDILLCEVASRLKSLIRAGDTIARLGGDEYAAIIVGAEHEGQVLVAAERLLAAMREPVLINQRELAPTASIGYSLFPNDAKDPMTLLRHADAAMYASKAAGRNLIHAYRTELGNISKEHMHILTRLRCALESNAFELFYQPQVDTKTGSIIGAEALLRWCDEELGWVAPDRFIPVAEASGQILPLGDWVLDRACMQISAWEKMGMSLPVAINLSPYQFRQPDLIEKIQAVCSLHRCPPHLLELEITESAAMLSPELTSQQLIGLAKAGFTIAIDDFGTGHSSLARLGRWKVHKLKIDRSFIVEIPGDPMYETLVRTTIRFATDMGFKLVAEGVETESQREFLANYGCEAFQGWLFSKALPAEEFLKLVRKNLEMQL